jgi:ABC-type Fe3+ transport system substrate-binding protein
MSAFETNAPVGAKPTNQFGAIISKLHIVKERAFEDLDLAKSICDALIGKEAQKEEAKDATSPSSQFSVVTSALDEITEILMDLRDVLNHIRKESVI